MPRRRPRQPQADRSRNECTAARDGDHRTLRPVQSWPPDLGPVHAAGNRSMVPARTMMTLLKALPMTFTRMALLVSMMCLALAACGDDAAEAEKASQAAAATAAFAAEQQAWREERRSSL